MAGLAVRIDSVLGHCAMSVQAMSWALSQQIVTDPTARHVLLCLANYANLDGTAAFPSNARLCKDTGLSERTIRRQLQSLLEAGIIKMGNQKVVAAYIDRSDQRPFCYDLILGEGSQWPLAQDDGVSLTTQRGVTVAPEPSYNHSSKTGAPAHTHAVEKEDFPIHAFTAKVGELYAKAFGVSKPILMPNHSQQMLTLFGLYEKTSNLDWWERFFAYCALDDFISGKTGFSVSFEYLLNGKNLARIVDQSQQGARHG